MIKTKFKLKPQQEDNFIEGKIEFKIKNNSEKEREIIITIK